MHSPVRMSQEVKSTTKKNKGVRKDRDDMEWCSSLNSVWPGMSSLILSGRPGWKESGREEISVNNIPGRGGVNAKVPRQV